jgi:hypothetical protein
MYEERTRKTKLPSSTVDKEAKLHESVCPRQARYQAALRPDMKWRNDYEALPKNG